MSGETMAEAYPEKLEIVPLAKPPAATVHVPGSKSITNRALVLAALSRPRWSKLENVLRSEDTEVMLAALEALGFNLTIDWPNSVVRFGGWGGIDQIPAGSADLFVENSGTTMRFLTAMLGLGHGRYRLDGTSRMRERPIEDLLSALQEMGVRVVSEANNGCPPVVVEAQGWRGGHMHVKGDVSSQFLSALLMAAPLAHAPVWIHVTGNMVSEPYVHMTLSMMRQWGFQYEVVSPTMYRIPAPQPRPALASVFSYIIEPDASAASYFFAVAALTDGRITVLDLPERSLQGDVHFADLLADMGCRVEKCSSGITVHGRSLRGIDVDMNAISDTVMTLAVVACLAEGPTTIRNVAHIRHKETDRLAALATELRKVGAEVEEFADGLTITPRPLHGAEIDTYNDHRMAMSMALIGLRVPGIVIRNPGCVAKTYPNFFEDLERLR
jgi:3-phosphoshikimate 1-carboxyvinyltransferase